MKLDELQFEAGKLVKVKGHRPEYMNGLELIALVKDLGEIVEALQHQLIEVIGTYDEYKDMPCQSLLARHKTAMERAKAKLGEL